jgi:hypothetical protein
MVFLFPESGHIFNMNRDDYEQYEAAYPDGVKLDPTFFAEASHSDGDADDEADVDTPSDSSSDFVSNPDEGESDPFAGPSTPPRDTIAEDEHSHSSPYKRPSHPEPTTPHPARFAEPTAISSLSLPEADSDSDAESDHSDTPDNADDAALITRPSSPYRARLSPISWTGLDLSPWGEHSYLCSHDNTMALHSEWDVQSGSCHGMLQRCEWFGYLDLEEANPEPVDGVPGLKLTNTNGVDFWLVDEAEYGYEFVYEGGEYAHWCEECAPGGLLYDAQKWDGEEVEAFGRQLLDAISEDEDESEMVKEFGRRLLAAIPEDEDEGDYPERHLDSIPEQGDDEDEDDAAEEGHCPHRLETIPEEDEDEADDDESDLEPVDEDLLDRLATAVLQECNLRKVHAIMVGTSAAAGTPAATKGQDEKVVEKKVQGDEKAEEKMGGDEKVEEELPTWMRDPWHVSGKSWADIMDEEEEQEY